MAGLVALVAVALVIGGIVGTGALVVTRSLGLDGSTAVDSGASEQATLYLPDPTDTETTPDALITLSGRPNAKPKKPNKSREPEPQPDIALSVTQTEVAPMERIDLTGVYPQGEGAILRVQRFENGSWSDFPVTASVSGGSFSTYIQTGQGGQNRFRMIDTDNGTVSNEVRVKIG